VLNKGDVFLKLRWAGKEAIALDGMSAMEISALLDQSNTENLLLYVRKQMPPWIRWCYKSKK
jgi:hypothetical protein